MGAKSGEREVRWEIRSRMYDLQAAIYCHEFDSVGERIDYYVIAVNDHGDVTPFRISLDARIQARQIWNDLIQKAHHLNMVGSLDYGPEFWAEHEGFFEL